MMFNKVFSINNTVKSEVANVKNTLDELTDNFVTHKTDSNMTNCLYPLVDIGVCQYAINKYPTLSAVIRVLSVDTIYNEFNFANIDKDELDVTDLIKFWKKNKSELRKTVENHLGFGYGAMEIGFDKDNPTKLKQIPAETLKIRQIEYDGHTYHFASYTHENDTDVLFKITREDYTGFPEDIFELDIRGWCIWIGGGNESRWYDRPIWFSAYTYIMTAIEKVELDFKCIQDGNVPKAIVLIKGPPENRQDGEMGIYDSLTSQISEAGGGVAMAYLETPMDSDDLRAEYIKVQDDNFDYLNELIDKTDTVILELYRVPKVRLMIDDNKESLNSNKSQTVYEIYTIDLTSYQAVYEEEIDIFTHLFWGKEAYCDIKTPIFTDTKQLQVQNIINLFDKGILTLKDAIEMIQSIYPEHDWEVDFSDPDLKNRFYEGVLYTTPNITTGLEALVQENMREGYDERAYPDDNSESESSNGQPTTLFN